MPTFRRPKDHEHPYAQIANDLLEDPSLSLKAKGLMAYLLSRSDKWEVYQAQLETIGPDGEHAVRTALQELRNAGYVERNRLHNESGQFDGYEYLLFEDPQPTTQAGGTVSGKSETGKSSTGFSSTGESSPTNTDEYQDGKNQSRSGSACALPTELFPLYDVYRPEMKEALQRYDPESADALVMNKWGQSSIGSTVMNLASSYEWPYFASGVVIAANEANNPNPRYLDTLLASITQLDDELESENPTEEEQQSHLERLWRTAQTA